MTTSQIFLHVEQKCHTRSKTRRSYSPSPKIDNDLPYNSEVSTPEPYSMTEDDLRERQQVKTYGRLSHQLYAGFIAFFSAISFGTALGWTSPMAYHITTDRPMSAKNFSWMVSMLPLGCTFGVTTWTVIMKHVGPKKSLQMQAPTYIVVWWCMLYPTEDAQLAGRFLLGFTGISYLICGEALLQQTVHFEIRKFISPAFNAAIMGGIFIANFLGFLVPVFVMTAICAVIPMAHFVFLLFVPESPVFLYSKSIKAAEDSLTWYRGRLNISMDMRMLRKDWEMQRIDPEAYKYMMFAKPVYKGLLIVMGVTFFQATSGYFIFMFFNIKVWNNRHSATGYPLFESVIISAYLVISKLIIGFVHQLGHFTRWRVKPVLRVSSAVVACQLMLLCLFLLFDHVYPGPMQYATWFPLIIVFILILFCDSGLNYFPKTLVFDYMPLEVYRKAYSIVQTFHWFTIFLNTFCYSLLNMHISSYITFCGLSLLTALGAVYCNYLVVEPRGKSLMQIQIEIGGNPVGHRGALYARTHMLDN